MRRVLPAIVLLLFFISNRSVSQVVIKEKVNINQNTKTISYQPPEYSPCGSWITSQTDYYHPYQVIWNNSWYNPDPYQKMNIIYLITQKHVSIKGCMNLP